MIAVEAIAGEEAFERVSPSLIAVTVESAVGRARLEVARPKSNAYPGAAPPLVSLAAADAASPPPRGALRAATAALAAAAAAAAEDGATCVYELMSLAPTALEEHATKPSPRSTSLSSSKRAANVSAPERSFEIGAKKNGRRVEKQTDGALDAASLVSRAPVRESQSKVQRERRDRGHRSRLPSKAFLEKENVRLKLAQEAYFGSTRIGGKSASADGARAVRDGGESREPSRERFAGRGYVGCGVGAGGGSFRRNWVRQVHTGAPVHFRAGHLGKPRRGDEHRVHATEAHQRHRPRRARRRRTRGTMRRRRRVLGASGE
jgi:hypothetical protein